MPGPSTSPGPEDDGLQDGPRDGARDGAPGAATVGARGTGRAAAVERTLAEAREETLHRLARLTGHFDELVAASANSNADDEHDPEGATIAFERSQLDSLVRRAREQLDEIEAARVRLAQGRYGVCESCGRAIAPGRLEARPVVRTCVACARDAAPRR